MLTNAADGPSIVKLLAKAKKQTPANAMCFLRLDHRRGSFGSCEGCGTRIIADFPTCWCRTVADNVRLAALSKRVVSSGTDTYIRAIGPFPQSRPAPSVS